MVLTEEQSVYGWGSNSNMQLSHEAEFSKVDNPLIAVYSPTRISKNMEENQITDIEAGNEFSFFVTKKKSNEETEVKLINFSYKIKGFIFYFFLYNKRT